MITCKFVYTVPHISTIYPSRGQKESKALAKQTHKSNTSQCKFTKPERAYRLAMGGQMDLQVGLQVHASRKKL